VQQITTLLVVNMKRAQIFLYFLSAVVFLFYSCSKENQEEPPPVCNKALNKSYTRSHEQYNRVSFSVAGSSSDFAAYAWTFGDGTSSTEKEPIHFYSADGVYQAKLTATTTCGDKVSSDTSVTICKNCFEYRFKCDEFTYTIDHPDLPPFNQTHSGEYGDPDDFGSFLNTGLNTSLNQIRIVEGATNASRKITLQFGDSLLKTTYGLPPVNANPGYTYENRNVFASATAKINPTTGALPYIGFAQSGTVSVTRSDTILEATFNVMLRDLTNVQTPFTGKLRVSRYKYFYP
jgi:PKD repeat protein